MKRLFVIYGAWAALLLWSGCSSTVESVKPPVRTLPSTKELLYRQGHQMYIEARYDSASALLKKALAVDSSYLLPLNDLAEMQYQLAMKEPGDTSHAKREHFKQAQEYYQKIEFLGKKDSDLYERLCEITYALGDDKVFLKYARKNAEAYPYERQYYNLGIAYFNVNDFQSVIRTQKLATEKFKSSSFIGSFYKQLGRAYMKVDRDQTAERTFAAGVQLVDARVADLRNAGGDYKSTDDYRRLMDDKIGMLLFLKKLHQTYDAKEKLAQVERQLKEAGYSR